MQHTNYWSCSPFADWIRGNKKLKSGTGKEWKAWKNQTKLTHPIRYWLAEEGLDYLQDFVTWPIGKLYDVKYYINNRWVTRSHSLTANPRDITPGNWCDLGNRFLPCLFNELVDFVEIELAWANFSWSDNAKEKYGVPWWGSGWFRLRSHRNPEAGLDYLGWASKLVMDETWGITIDDPSFGKPTHQAIAAQEIATLYNWWTTTYRNRPDPHEEGGWTAYCEMRRKNGYDLLDMDDKTPEEAEMCKTALNNAHEIETRYDQEDEDMLIRLIKIRNSLWT